MKRQTKPSASEVLAKNLFKRTPRPTLGDSVSISLLQDRAVLFALSPGMGDVMYYAGREVGNSYAKRLKKVRSLREALDVYAESVLRHRLARVEIRDASRDGAVLRLHECAGSYGLPDLGIKVCAFDAGGQAGTIGRLTGKRVVSIERKCNANGDRYCEFALKVLAEAGTRTKRTGRR